LTNEALVQSIAISNSQVLTHSSSVSPLEVGPSIDVLRHRNRSKYEAVQSLTESVYESEDITEIIQALHDKVYLRTIKQAQFIMLDREQLLI